MNLGEIEREVASLDVDQGFNLVYDLLRAYGISNASISRLKSGSYNKAEHKNELLWKDKIFFRFVDDGDDLHDVIDEARHDELVTRYRPRFLIVCDDRQILAADTRTSDTLDIQLTELSSYSAFFLPWAGIEKTQLESINYADAKAAEKMARLYDEIVTHNLIETSADVHSLNIFFSRLLFCFFAEDTDVFANGIFTNGIASLTAEDGSDTARYLDELFKVLDLDPKERNGVPAHFASFGYVNGKLFAAQAASPAFSARSRRLMLECGTLNWSIINPDIFGSMMQAVVHPGQRESLGMHYTSVENIMKVIRPLFLDDLHQAFEGADTKAKLERLLKRISEIKFFDPACGSGNFLVIAYKELRKLEHRVLKRIAELDPKAPISLFQLSGIKLENFYGIEIDDFAHEVAILSLWLAKHQMNVEFRELFGVEIALIPLKDTGNIVCDNAARFDWDAVCPLVAGDEAYLLGNPPYQGGTKQSNEQKADLVAAFGETDINRYLDYVSIWLFKGAKFVVAHDAELGFVVTSSVSQGNHVGLLWPHILATGAEITFAYAPFLWSNSAKHNAGVTCVIVGLAPSRHRSTKSFYRDGTRREAAAINSYLVPDGANVIVVAQDERINGFPKMAFGSMARDHGHLILNETQRTLLLKQYPEAHRFIKTFVGAEELLNGGRRYCIWVADSEADEALLISPFRDRFDLVRKYREASDAASTRQASAFPYRFVQIAHRETNAIVVPRHSSENRRYIPMAFTDHNTVASDACSVIYDAQPWLFALLTSRMHNLWVRAVSGTLASRIRYSATLCYNTFPVPGLADTAKTMLAEHTFAVLEAREHHSDLTLAQMYAPDRIPDDLRGSHRELDEAVDHLYRKRPFGTDDDRLDLLFKMYEAAMAGTEFQGELELAIRA